MITGPYKYYTVAESIRVAVDAALSNQVQRSCVVPGAIAWDECSCGMLAVSVGRMFLSDNFPEEQSERVGGCQSAWEVCDIVIQVIRCAPLPPDGEMAPTCEALDTAAQIMAVDLQETLAAVSLWICEHRYTDINDGLVMPTEPQGPEGDCVGSEMHVLIGFARG